MHRLSNFDKFLLLVFSCLFAIGGCKPSANHPSLQSEESDLPSLEIPREPTLRSKEVSPFELEDFKEKPQKFRVPSYTRKSENGRPVIIKAKMSTGKFKILNNCLVFMNESNGKIGAVLLGPETYVSKDRDLIIVSRNLTVPIGKRLRVGGYIQSNLFYEAEYLNPPIPKTCPDLVINVGGIHEIKQ